MGGTRRRNDESYAKGYCTAPPVSGAGAAGIPRGPRGILPVSDSGTPHKTASTVYGS